MDDSLVTPWRPLTPQQADDGLLLPETVTPRPDLPLGPFAHLPDGTIAARDDDRVRLSGDSGATWDEGVRFVGDEYEATPEGAIGAAEDGSVVFGFADRHRMSRPDWKDLTWGTTPATLPCCLARSPDGGKTWQPLQTLHEDWTGSVRDMIRMRNGRLVMTSMKILYQPLRHGCMTYFSDDHGATWHGSNLLDYGGIGNHDGALEPSIVELSDGSLYMLIRTNWHQFWRAMSWDGGAHWHTLGPTGIDAGSAPGMLLWLASGRIALVWNRLHPSTGRSAKWLRGGDMHWSATPTNNFREELSISFSEDDCKTWSPPRVAVRQPDRGPSYPYLFEPTPGAIWLTTQSNFSALKLELREADWV